MARERHKVHIQLFCSGVKAKKVGIGDCYFRVVRKDWPDPVNTSYAANEPDNRWNILGTPCLYLTKDIPTAIENARQKYQNLFSRSVRLSDVYPHKAFVVISVKIPRRTGADAYTDCGLKSLKLPTTYPLGTDARPVPRGVCRTIGSCIEQQGSDGIDCRSAVENGGRELVWFPRPNKPAPRTLGTALDCDALRVQLNLSLI